jgi:hypothetical protein
MTNNRWIYTRSNNSNGLRIKISHLNIKLFFEGFGHSGTYLDSNFLFLATNNFAVHRRNIQKGFPPNIIKINLKLIRNLAIIFKVNLLGSILTKPELPKIKFLLTNPATNQRAIPLQLNLIIRTTLNMTNRRRPIQYTALGVVYVFDLLDLVGIQFS